MLSGLSLRMLGLGHALNVSDRSSTECQPMG